MGGKQQGLGNFLKGNVPDVVEEPAASSSGARAGSGGSTANKPPRNRKEYDAQRYLNKTLPQREKKAAEKKREREAAAASAPAAPSSPLGVRPLKNRRTRTAKVGGLRRCEHSYRICTRAVCFCWADT